MKIFNKFLFTVILLLLSIENIFALNLNSEKYILYNMNDDEIISENDSHVETNIASLTKLMTIIVSIENIKDFDKKITITREMIEDIEWDVAVAGFEVGDKVTYNDLLYGAMLPSGADAVNALAISIGGTLDKFVDKMNAKVKELKLENTHFENVTGLFGTQHYSSAYDVAQILKYSLRNKKFKEIFEAKSYTTTNNLKLKSTLEYYSKKTDTDISYIKGSKTGYIKKSGYCLASTAKIDGVNYMLVTLNAYNENNSPHIKDATTIYKYYSENYSYKPIVTEEDIIVNIKTNMTKEKNIDIKAKTNIEKYLSNDFDKDKIVYNYSGVHEINYFTKKETLLGEVEIKYNDDILGTFNLFLKEELSFSVFAFLWYYKFYLIIIIILIILILKIRKNKKRRSKIKITYS